jgi:dihydrofolate reductase
VNKIYPQHLLQRKTRFVAFVAASIDERISLSEKTLLRWTSKEDWQFSQRSLSRADAVVVGRNTHRAAARRLRKRDTFVLSNRLRTMAHRGNVTFVNPTNVDLASLLAKYKTVVALGGGTVYRFMWKADFWTKFLLRLNRLFLGGERKCLSAALERYELTCYP